MSKKSGILGASMRAYVSLLFYIFFLRLLCVLLRIIEKILLL